jgi:hypothetical protein
MTGGRVDWQQWHRDYDDPDSSVSRRLVQVRARLAMLLDEAAGPVRLLSLCSGDGRDVVPVLASSDRDVDACLVELDPGLAEGARRAAAEAGVQLEVRTGDAAAPTTYADRLPVAVLLLVGVLGNVSDADAETTIAACASMVVPGGVVLWSRSSRFRAEPTHGYADPSVWARDRFEAHGFETREFLVPEVGAWRLGLSVLRRPSPAPLPERLFSFVR